MVSNTGITKQLCVGEKYFPLKRKIFQGVMELQEGDLFIIRGSMG